jgi:putative transposase
MAESFVAALKDERVHRTAYPTRARTKADIIRYIEFWYNPKRLHSGLGYESCQEALDEWTNMQKARLGE